jgi:hypothetical protein
MTITIQRLIITMFRSLDQAQIAHAHRMAAMSVYITNLSFNHFENAHVIAHFQVISLEYKPPHLKLVRGKLLNEAYSTVKSKMYQKLNACNHLSFFTDETINIRKERVINLCCHVSSFVTSNGGDYHLKAVFEVADKMTTAVQVD